MIAVPYLANVVSLVQHVRQNKVDNGGKIKLTAADAVRIFGVDGALLAVVMIGCTVLAAKGGLRVVPKYGT